MAVTVNDLRDELGAGASVQLTVLDRCLTVADALLKQYVGDRYTTVPAPIYDEAWLAVAVERFNQRKAPNGILNQTFMAADGSSVATPVRIGADPLRPAYPILERWLGEADGVTFA
ncbi:MAG TPA: hypothetical protein VGF17_20815 [Phytomonospora sp.]